MIHFPLCITLVLSLVVAEQTEIIPATTTEIVVSAEKNQAVTIQEKLVTASQETIPTEQKSPITITNAITPDMLSYKHWTGTYSPDTFTVSVNGNPLQSGESCAIAHNTTVEVQYEYSFVNGYRTGKEIESYTMNENSSTGTITFSWNNKPHHVCIDNAQPQSVKKT
jgi:hypothetical protein